MSFPKIDLSSFVEKKKEKKVPKLPKLKIWYFSPLLLLPFIYFWFSSSHFRHMMPLKCSNRLGHFKCRLRSEGKVTIISTCSSIREFSFANTKLPAHLFRVGTDSFSFYVNGPLMTVKTVPPGCKVDVYLEELDFKQNFIPSVVWVTTSSHHHFTVKAGSETILDRIPAVMLEPSRLGQYVAYYHELCHPSIKVEGDASDTIWVYSC